MDRTNGKIDFGVPLKSLVSISEIESFEPEECPISREGKLPLVRPAADKSRHKGGKL